MNAEHFQEEETYLYSSLLQKLKEMSHRGLSLPAKCLFAAFWKIQDDKKRLDELSREIEGEIGKLNPDPTREKSLIPKVFACSIYKAVSGKPKHDETIKNYLSYAADSRDWLGQPRIASCVSLLKAESISDQAKTYLKENFSPWLTAGRDDFLALALIGLKGDISDGDLQRAIEHIEPKISRMPIEVVSQFLIGLSQNDKALPGKDEVEDKLYFEIKKRLANGDENGNEALIFTAAALNSAKYHKISGYFQKYSDELIDTLDKKGEYEKYKSYGCGSFMTI